MAQAMGEWTILRSHDVQAVMMYLRADHCLRGRMIVEDEPLIQTAGTYGAQVGMCEAIRALRRKQPWLRYEYCNTRNAINLHLVGRERIDGEGKGQSEAGKDEHLDPLLMTACLTEYCPLGALVTRLAIPFPRLAYP
jgi:hypothetical protein